MSARISTAMFLLALTACAPVGAEPLEASVGTFKPAALAAACAGRDGWSDPAPPAQLYANSWLVGTCGITVVLITSPQGHVLIDSGPAEAANLVAANIAKLGYTISDVKLILSSHEHYDHVGGMAELQRLSGAAIAALAAARPVLASGNPAADDPQHDDLPPMAPVTVTQTLSDGEQVQVGPITLTAYSTPAHTSGSTSWTWESCDKADCRTITYADSISAISADSYRFTDHPDRVEGVRAGLARVAELPCGILITPHPSSSDMFERFASGAPLDQPASCKSYAATGSQRFAKRLKSEAKK